MQATDVATILCPQSPYIYGHGQAAMLRPLRTHALEICAMVCSAGSYHVYVHEPASQRWVDDGAHIIASK